MKNLLSAIALMFATLPAFAQIGITYQNPDSLYVCGQDTFFVHLKNNGAAPSAALSVEISTNPGISYVAASISGAAELDISNLEKPVFSVGPIPAGQVLTLKMLLSPDCSVVGKIDMGGQFFNKIAVFGGGAQPVTTINFLVETGLVVIQSVSPTNFSGMLNDQFQRTIVVKNTRFGKISTLHFTDERDKPWVDMAVAGGTVTASSPTLFRADFDGNFIKNYGDGDVFFEKDEVITFTETVTIKNCGLAPPPLPLVANSKIRVGWGCGGEICSYDSTDLPVLVTVEKFTKSANVIYSIKTSPPLNRCGEKPATQRILLKNIGLWPAETFILELQRPVNAPINGGFLANSFRLVSAAGAVTPLSPVLSMPLSLPNCTQQFSTKATLSLPDLPGGDSIWVEADLYNCQDACTRIAQDLEANLFYTKPPCGGFDSKQFFVVTSPTDSSGVFFVANIETEIGTCIEDGKSYPFEFVVSSNLIDTISGVLHLTTTLPPGFSLDPDCPLFVNGQPPLSVAQTGQTVVVQTALPLGDSIARMPFCLIFDCPADLPCITAQFPQSGGALTIPVPLPGDTACFGLNGCAARCFLKMPFQASITELPTDDPDCGLNFCNDIPVAVANECNAGPGDDPNGPTGGSPNSTFIGDFMSARVNFGHADTDDDRFANQPLFSAENQPNRRRDRFMTGDTVRLGYSGTVIVGGGYTGFPLKFYHEIVKSDAFLNGADECDVQSGQFEWASADTGFVFVQGNLRIKYANGTTATCPIIAPTFVEDAHFAKLIALNISPEQLIDEVVSASHEFDLKLPELFDSGCLLKPTLDLGDSIFVATDYKMMGNFTSAPPPFKLSPPLINTRNAQGWIGNQPFAWNCYPHKPMQYSGFKEYLRQNTFGIRPCENSVEPKSFRYSILIARPNMFPFEVRPLTKILEYKQGAPAQFALQSALLRYLVLQDSVPVLKDLPLAATKIGDFLIVDFAPVFAQPHDEGMIFSTKITWLPDCNFTDPDTSIQLIKFQYPNCFWPQPIFERLYENAIGYFANTAVLKATGPVLVTSQTGLFDLSFLVKNQRVSPAVNSWAFFTDSLGTTSNFEVFQNGAPLAMSNGVFQLGSIGSFLEKNLQVKLRSTSCGPEKIFLNFGWSCAPLTTPPSPGEACGHDTLTIELQNLATELDLAIIAEPAEIPLCAESGFFEIEVFNAKIGHAFDVLASVKLPQGLSISPGSAQISYPTGAAWQPTADPTALAGNLFLWEINDLLPSLVANGLPGVDEIPKKNSIRIRFKVVAECGFVAESQPIFATEGIEPCGIRTNNLRKTGDPIHLAGVAPSYSAQVSLNAAGGQTPVSCGETVKLDGQISLSGTPSPGDSIIILLPPGVSFVAGSYVAGVGGPAGPPIFSGNRGRLPIPTNSPSPFINFSFQIKYDQPVGCLDAAVLLQVVSATTAICASTGQPCGVSVANGEAIWFLPTENPEIALTELVIIETAPGVWGFDATVQNPSGVNAALPTMQLFEDINMDGLLDAGDVLLGNFTQNGGLAAGQTGHILGNLPGNPPGFCALLAVFPAAENCACNPAVFPVSQNLDIQHLPLVFCSPIISVKFGVDSLPGSTYEWLAASGTIGCANCAMTTFEFPPGAQPGAAIELVLLEKRPGCTRKHHFSITFGAAFDLSASDKIICRGEKTVLSAISSAGGNFAWNGPGATGQTGQTLTLSPTQNAFYTVTVTLASGCTGMASVLIEVLPTDSVFLPKIVKCPGDTIILEQNVSQPGVYFQKLKNSDGCDSTVFVEVQFKNAPASGENLTICFGDTALVNGQIVTQSGSFSQNSPAANGCDSTHTINLTVLPKLPVSLIDTIFAAPGDTITINAPGGFSSYVWSYPFVNCGGCTSPFFVADSLGTYEFGLTVTNSSGCTGDAVVVLRINPICDPASIKIPNAFTPDGDGLNDSFQPVAPEGGETIARLRIYDRWGELVFDKNGTAAMAGWDGKIRGKAGPMDVYVWVLDISCASGDGQRVGDVTLVR